DRARCGGTRPVDAAGRALRSRERDLLIVVEADPRRAALPRAVRIPPGCRGARRARNPAARRRPSGLADALRHAACSRAAAALDDPHRAFPLRPSLAPLAASRLERGAAVRSLWQRPEAGAEARLRLLGLPRRRCAPG